MIPQKQWKAILQLLDDEDTEVWQEVKRTLAEQGPEIVPQLEKAWENIESELAQERLENLIQSIQLEQVISNLTYWKYTGGVDLLEGAMLVAQYQYPTLDKVAIRKQIEQLQQEVWQLLVGSNTPLGHIRILNHIFFEIHKFVGNKQDYDNPSNTYINHVLESKKGNPLLLSILYIVVAQGVRLPIYGINAPQHFVVGYTQNVYDDTANPPKVILYINPFGRGIVFTERELDTFLEQLNIPIQAAYKEPCSNIMIIKRMLNNLLIAYQKANKPRKVKDIEKFLAIFNG